MNRLAASRALTKCCDVDGCAIGIPFGPKHFRFFIRRLNSWTANAILSLPNRREPCRRQIGEVRTSPFLLIRLGSVTW